jgi:hypothetical protein
VPPQAAATLATLEHTVYGGYGGQFGPGYSQGYGAAPGYGGGYAATPYGYGTPGSRRSELRGVPVKLWATKRKFASNSQLFFFLIWLAPAQKRRRFSQGAMGAVS